MHLYSEKIGSAIEIGRCDELADSVQVRRDHVLIFCKLGHLIKGRIFTTERDAERFAARLVTKLNLEII